MVKGIDEKIQSMNYCEYIAHIKTVDAQESLGGGVIVLVTGYLIGKDNVKRDFIQTFFLATQDKGYYVLNDIFRYVEDADLQEDQDLTHEAGDQTTEHGMVWISKLDTINFMTICLVNSQGFIFFILQTPFLHRKTPSLSKL